MHILGINAYHGNASAALVSDGRLIAAVEEERFNRVKYAAGFPSAAIRYCLEAAGITLARSRPHRHSAQSLGAPRNETLVRPEDAELCPRTRQGAGPICGHPRGARAGV